MTLRSRLNEAARRAYIGISRGTLVKADDGKKWQALTIRGEFGERYTDVEHAQPYGVAFRPHPPADEKTHEAAEVILVFPDGSRSHPIVLVTGDRRHRIQLGADGEVALYDDQGQQVYLGRDRVVIHSTKEIHAQREDAHVLLSADKAKMQKGDMSVTCKNGKVFLGKEDVTHAVITADGQSNKVFAAIDESDSAMEAASVGQKVG